MAIKPVDPGHNKATYRVQRPDPGHNKATYRVQGPDPGHNKPTYRVQGPDFQKVQMLRNKPVNKKNLSNAYIFVVS